MLTTLKSFAIFATNESKTSDVGPSILTKPDDEESINKSLELLIDDRLFLANQMYRMGLRDFLAEKKKTLQMGADVL